MTTNYAYLVSAEPDDSLPAEIVNKLAVDLPEAGLFEALTDPKRSFAGETVIIGGNSWVQGGGDYTPPYHTLLSEALGVEEVIERGLAGRWAQDNAWAMVNSAHPIAWDPAAYGAFFSNDFGNNLMGPDSELNRRSALEAGRTIVALASAAKRVEQSAFTFKPNGSGENWADESAQPFASGGSLRTGVFGDLEVDIPVEAGTSYLLGHGTDPAAIRGMTLHAFQNGVQIATKSFDSQTLRTNNAGESSTGISPVVMRLPHLKAGKVTIKTDRANIEGATAFIDGLLPQARKPRLIVLVKPVDVTAPSHIKPELLAYLRTIPDLLRNEFGDYILVVDPQPGWNPLTMLGADGLHPTLLGTQHVVAAIQKAVKAYILERLSHQILFAA